ncbi:PREDICTED: CASP-like protein 4B1 [Nicotiana attenuata]|uniref:CASP-like protein n=1 Tax=Nicotiana attenuata TaxID=49451 RepID=A0A1J6I9Q8_NICAT|nr:PREDICTED: CASP-like protein 4B1 [Nicotiana attenuata]OIT01282.1 casp-like protein 4b4 [Nicotiana attenuata]
MSDPNDQKATVGAPIPTAPPAAGDTESQTPAAGTGVGHIIRKWKREDLLKRGSLGLRCIALLFSLLAFIIMASNKHGDWKDFDRYEEYRYVLAIAILSTLYTGLQVMRQVHELSTSKEAFSRQNLALLEFFGDQLMAYLLLSSASSAVPLTNKMRENNDNIFTDSSASAISMEFIAFLALAVSAMIAGYKLSNQTYI